MNFQMLNNALFRPLMALIPATLVAVGVDIVMHPSLGWSEIAQISRMGGLAVLVEATLLIPAALLSACAWIGAKTLIEISGVRKKPSEFAGVLLGLIIGGFTASIIYLLLFRFYYVGLDVSFLEKKELAGQVIGIVSWLQLCFAGAVGLVVAGFVGLPISRFPNNAGSLIVMVVRWVAFGLALGTLLAGFALHRSVDNLRVFLQAPLIALSLIITFAASYSFLGQLKISKVNGAITTVIFTLALAGVSSGALFSEHARAEVESRLVLPRILLANSRAWLDFDGDGFSALFGGGDCDDGDRFIYPGARDIPGNNLDEDCADGDAMLPVDRAAPTPAQEIERDKKDTNNPAPAPMASEKTQSTTEKPPGANEYGVAGASSEITNKPQNLVIVLIDTLRADRMSAAGYSRKITANLDRLAQRGQHFTHAYAQSNHTPKSIPSIFSGKFPSDIPWQNPDTNYPAVADSALLLAEIFRENGFDTSAITEHHYFKLERNIRQGFQSWDNGDGDLQSIRSSNTMTTAPSITKRSKKRLDLLAKSSAPFLLFVHYSDPHAEYMRHPKPWRFGKALKDRYDGEIAFCDHHLGDLIQHMEGLGLHRNTAIIVLSDHGEAFGEHRFHFHGHALFNEEIRVPLIMTGPGIVPGNTSAHVGLIDVLPTVVELFALKKRLPKDLPGRSLVPLLQGKTMPPRHVYAQLLPYPQWPEEQHALIDGDLKMIYHRSRNLWMLFDLEKDPAERKNLMRSHGESSRLQQQLREIIQAKSR